MSDLVIRHTWKDSARFVPRLVIQPLQRLMDNSIAGAAIMLLATVIALVWANSSLSSVYEDFWGTKVTFAVGGFDTLSGIDLRHWVNDGLMTLFFLLVSLEIKRELVSGHLSNLRDALMPVVAAIGGMIVPAVIFVVINKGGEGRHGWGIPMATDIVFAVAILTLFGSRLPSALRVFLLTLAVADDLGAIAVIAVFYNDGISVSWLGIAAGTIAAVAIFQRAHIRSLGVFIILGAICWYALLECGIHPTIAGVAFGLLTPAWSFYDPRQFAARATSILGVFTRACEDGKLKKVENDDTQSALRDIRRLSTETHSPLQRVELHLASWVTFAVVPVFAFANAGVRLDWSALANLPERPVLLGIVVGLVVGKPLGIVGALVIVQILGVRSIPAGATWPQTTAVAMCGGIGFTVALFVGELAYPPGALADDAKIAVLLASIIASLLSLLLLFSVTKSARR